MTAPFNELWREPYALSEEQDAHVDAVMDALSDAVVYIFDVVAAARKGSSPTEAYDKIVRRFKRVVTIVQEHSVLINTERCLPSELLFNNAKRIKREITHLRTVETATLDDVERLNKKARATLALLQDIVEDCMFASASFANDGI